MVALASNARSFITTSPLARMMANPCLWRFLEGWINGDQLMAKIVGGFGHRFHKPIDPRAPRLLALVREAAVQGIVSGRFAEIGEVVHGEIGRQRGQPIAMNIDGATAVIFCELGLPAPLSRGLFCLSCSLGILAHAWEQINQGGRKKGPMPPAYLPLCDPAKE